MKPVTEPPNWSDVILYCAGFIGLIALSLVAVGYLYRKSWSKGVISKMNVEY